MKYNHYINLIQKQFVNQSLVYYGILLQNNQTNLVNNARTKLIPYYALNEGIICDPEVSNKIRNTPNVDCYHYGKIVLQKRTNTVDPILTIDNGIYDLYNQTDKDFVYSKINELENNRNFYSKNTEPYICCNNVVSVAGCASGYHLAQMAFESRAQNLVYTDYSKYSLYIQKQLIYSSNRKQLLIDNLDMLTIGHRNTTLSDIEAIDFTKLNNYYDYLKNINVNYYCIDYRNIKDIESLNYILPNNSVLWISNSLHYITSLDYYNTEIYQALDNLITNKSITILPHTRVYYEC